jgi:tetratricopeptide (TPR) repeat protein
MPAPTLPVRDRHQQAVLLYSAGKFATALSMVKPLLEPLATVEDNDLAESLNLAALCSLGLKQLADTEAYWRRCIEIKPDHCKASNGLGMLLKALRRLPEAEAVFRHLIDVCPDDALACNSLGAVLYELGRKPEAESAYTQALSIKPDYFEARYNLGMVLEELRRHHDAETAYRLALAIRPGYADAHHRLGNVLRERGRLDEAALSFQQALAIKPQFVEALNNLGGVLQALNRPAEAEASYRQALTIRPDFASAHLNLGVLLFELKRVPEAETAYRHAISHRADFAQAHCYLGIALQALDRLAQAETAYRQAIHHRPELVEAHHNLGCLLRIQGRLPEAAQAIRQALSLRPDLPEAHNNLANVLLQLDRLLEAEAFYRTALALRPGYDEARFGLAAVLLSMGHFAEGWPLYESRYEQSGFVHSKMRSLLRCPQWGGESLAGKSLLVWQEDGLGDMIQFSRYLPLLKAQGAGHITLACEPALQGLLATIEGVDAVLDHDTAWTRSSEYDCWASLLSAPCHLHTTLDTIPPAVVPRAHPSLVERWRTRLDTLPSGPRVGLVWKGNPKHHNDANRSLPSLATLAPLWSVPGIQFVSLQKGRGEDEAQSPCASQPILHLGSDVKDFTDSAAIVDQLDLVICVDTSIAHLVASLGKPCWVLLPGHDVDWRWMRERTDSPWYPGVLRLFRQMPGEPWSTTIEKVREACAERFSSAGRRDLA